MAAERGRVAVVTGANKGIGFSIAQQLIESAQFGRVILGCRDESRGRAAAAALQRSVSGGSAAVVVEFESLDIASSESIESFAARMETVVGRCDCLVNNAAIAFKGADPTPFAAQTAPTLAINYWVRDK
eukprot:SAG31_NODE_1896_length_6964_cov_3.399854_1_plen_129_part_00